jgi:hypothetical protein
LDATVFPIFSFKNRHFLLYFWIRAWSLVLSSLTNLAFPVNLDVFLPMANFFLFMLMSAITSLAVRTVSHELIHYTGIFRMIEFDSGYKIFQTEIPEATGNTFFSLRNLTDRVLNI